MANARPPLNGVLYGLTQAIVVFGMIPGLLPKPIRILGLAVFGWIGFLAITTQTTGDHGGDLGLGSAIISQFMMGIDFVLLQKPDEMKDLTETTSKKITERSFKERFLWALNLFMNPRGVGWTHEPPYLGSRPSPSTSRWKFVSSRIIRIVLLILLDCAIYVIDVSNPGLSTPGKVLSDAPFHWRALGVAGFAAAGAARITVMHSLLAILVVGLGLSSPERWPNIFGSPREGWSVQRLWRRVWHQLLRKSILSCTSIIVPNSSPSGKPFKPLTMTRKFLRLYIAFFLVAVTHIGGETMLLGKFGGSAFKFFMLQPFGITFEIIVVSLWSKFTQSTDPTPMKTASQNGTNGYSNGTRNGSAKDSSTSQPYTTDKPDLWKRCLGYAWVTVWSSWTVAYMVDPMVTVGMFIDPRFDLRRWGWRL